MGIEVSGHRGDVRNAEAENPQGGGQTAEGDGHGKDSSPEIVARA